MRWLTLIAILYAYGATAQEAEERFGQWQVFTHTEHGKTLCYAGTKPTQSTGSFKERKDVYLMVTRRESGKLEISASSGYSYMRNSKIELLVDDKPTRLFAKNMVAWARSDAEDKTLLETIPKAKTIELRGASVEGVSSIDHFSPEGFAEAVAKVKALCP